MESVLISLSIHLYCISFSFLPSLLLNPAGNRQKQRQNKNRKAIRKSNRRIFLISVCILGRIRKSGKAGPYSPDRLFCFMSAYDIFLFSFYKALEVVCHNGSSSFHGFFRVKSNMGRKDGVRGGKEGIVFGKGRLHIEYIDAGAGDFTFFSASARASLSMIPPLAVLIRIASFS